MRLGWRSSFRILLFFALASFGGLRPQTNPNADIRALMVELSETPKL
jgi:hypothetical protein